MVYLFKMVNRSMAMLVITRGHIPSKCRIPILRVRATTSRAGSTTCQEKLGAVWKRMEPYETSPYFNHFWGEFYGCFVYFATISRCEQTLRKITMSPTCFLMFNQFQGYMEDFLGGRNRLDRRVRNTEANLHSIQRN